jgi:hypothetical protein
VTERISQLRLDELWDFPDAAREIGTPRQKQWAQEAVDEVLAALGK